MFNTQSSWVQLTVCVVVRRISAGLEDVVPLVLRPVERRFRSLHTVPLVGNIRRKGRTIRGLVTLASRQRKAYSGAPAHFLGTLDVGIGRRLVAPVTLAMNGVMYCSFQRDATQRC